MFTSGIEKLAAAPCPGDTKRYPPLGLAIMLVPARDGLAPARILVCCSCCKLETSVAVVPVGLMMKKGCWTIGMPLAGIRYTGLAPVLPTVKSVRQIQIMHVKDERVYSVRGNGMGEQISATSWQGRQKSLLKF